MALANLPKPLTPRDRAVWDAVREGFATLAFIESNVRTSHFRDGISSTRAVKASLQKLRRRRLIRLEGIRWSPR